MRDGYYYLHSESKDLIFKRYLDDGQVADFRESDFVVMFWPIDLQDRLTAWNLLVEAGAAGANPERIHELARKWKCDNRDAQIYAKQIGVSLGLNGVVKWCATCADSIDMMVSPAGFGDTCLEALIDLCRGLKYKPVKTWRRSFAELVKTEKKGGPYDGKQD